MTDDDHATIAAHFASRDEAEARYFAGDGQLRLAPGAVDRVGPPNIINDPAEIDRMASLEPDLVLVFGTGLLRQPIIDRFAGRIINLHLGLSPHYRGAGTNFWPLVNREPEFVGATIHYLDAGIDTGAMIAHARPDIEPADGPHDVGNKAIVAAARVLAAAAGACARPGAERAARRPRTLVSAQGFLGGRRAPAYQQFAQGMIAEYLANRAERDRPLRLLTLARMTAPGCCVVFYHYVRDSASRGSVRCHRRISADNSTGLRNKPTSSTVTRSHTRSVNAVP